MHSKASLILSKAFQVRGVQARLSERTKISQSRLSRLADETSDTVPNLEHSLALKDDPEVPIDPSWWSEPAETPENAQPETIG